MGSGGNWDQYQTLNAGQVEWPTGPLTGFASTDKIEYVEAWVMQRHTGASQRSWKKNPGSGLSTWTADKGVWRGGKFEPGCAIGTALVSWEDDNGDYHFIWWTDQIYLVSTGP